MFKAATLFVPLAVGCALLAGCQTSREAGYTADTEPQPLPYEAFDPGPAPAPGSAPGTSHRGDAGHTPAPTFDPLPAPLDPAPPPPTARTSHTVAAGDTLWNIAVRHYGDGQRWRDIAAANNITNPATLRVGQVLRLP